jgi:mannose-6-phosphate isomerase-like protein (cupin superfamily)
VSEHGFDLSRTYVHLGTGSRAVPIADFRWTPEFLASYAEEFASDAREGRLVMVGANDSSWNFWERHPAGDELVVVISGSATLVQEIDGDHERITLGPGEAAINPRGTWHTSDLVEPGQVLFVTPGMGTEHRPR